MLDQFVTMQGNTCAIRLQDIHLSMHEDIFHALDEVLESFSPTAISLDLSDINKLNSTGIGRLVYLKKYINDECSLPLSIDNINTHTLKTLKTVKVDEVLGIQS